MMCIGVRIRCTQPPSRVFSRSQAGLRQTVPKKPGNAPPNGCVPAELDSRETVVSIDVSYETVRRWALKFGRANFSCKNSRLAGGGSSHQRTGLRPLVPCSTGKYREIRRFRASDSQGASAFGRKFNRLPTEFPSRLSRENLRAIREPEAGNREPYPNDP